MEKTVDSYKFTGGITKRMLQTWAKMEKPREIPWTPLEKSLSACRVSLITSGGIALKTDTPFDQEGERQNPWWGDPTYRVIPRGTKTEEIKVYHLHVDPSYAEADINSLLPIDRLDELATAGEIGSAAPSHYATMGYSLQPKILLEETTPKIIHRLKDEGVDAVVLVPA
jgi:D-proline reductase (dithiol) PrdB